MFSEEEKLCPLSHSARLRRLCAHSNTLYTILCMEVYSLCRSTQCLWACLRPLVAIENNPLETSVSEHLHFIPRINRYYLSSWIWNIVTADPSFKSIPICPVCLCSNISLSSYESYQSNSLSVFEYFSFCQGTTWVQDKAVVQQIQCIVLAKSK